MQHMRTDSPTGIRRADKQWQPLTDRQREEIDAETKQLLRQLNASIRNLADAEQLRQNTEATVNRRKYARTGLGTLGKWAAGGVGQAKTYEEELDDSRSQAIKMHRENVLWYVRQKLQECGGMQASMMETRITRELEKNKSVLYKTRGEDMPEFGGFEEAPVPPPTNYKRNKSAYVEEQQEQAVEDQLTPEQIQVFEKENLDMLKQYEATFNQVRQVRCRVTA